MRFNVIYPKVGRFALSQGWADAQDTIHQPLSDPKRYYMFIKVVAY